MKKSSFCESAIMHLGKIYQEVKHVIDINHFKNTSRLNAQPTTGAELVAMLSFFYYFGDYMENLSHLVPPLRAIVEKCQGAQQIKWTPDTEKSYRTLVTCHSNIGGLAVLPDDPNQVESIVIASDACTKTIGYTLGAVIHKEVTEKESTDMHKPRLSFIRTYSCTNYKHDLVRRAHQQLQESMINYWNPTNYYTSKINMHSLKQNLYRN